MTVYLLHCMSILLLVACYARMSWIEPLLAGKTAAVWSSCLWSCLNVANHRSFNNQQWFPALCESVEECELMLRHVGNLIYASFIRSWEEFQVITRENLSITHLKGSVSKTVPFKKQKSFVLFHGSVLWKQCSAVEKCTHTSGFWHARFIMYLLW